MSSTPIDSEVEERLWKILNDYDISFQKIAERDYVKIEKSLENQNYRWFYDYSIHSVDRLYSRLKNYDTYEYKAICYDVYYDKYSRLIVSLFIKNSSLIDNFEELISEEKVQS